LTTDHYVKKRIAPVPTFSLLDPVQNLKVKIPYDRYYFWAGCTFGVAAIEYPACPHFCTSGDGVFDLHAPESIQPVAFLICSLPAPRAAASFSTAR
jgi:hypothetical protein